MMASSMFDERIRAAVETRLSDSDGHDAVESKRNDQGRHECEVFRGGPESYEFESARAWSRCTKNPDHQGFIPYPDFRLEHLPKCCQTKAFYTQVKGMAGLTARVRVGYTSKGRPEGYTFYKYRGLKIPHTGSGYCMPGQLVQIPAQLARDHYPDHCCPGCVPNSGQPVPQHEQCCVYEFKVVTARHVVYNTEEAKSTQVDFFYDDENSEFNGEMKTAYGYDVETVPEKDISIMRCITHDKDLFDGLDMAASKVRYYGTKVASPLQGPASVIVSHPHGRPKQVTVGEAKLKGMKFKDDLFSYATSTCPGSSGAPVMWYFNTATHSVGGRERFDNQGYFHFPQK